MGSLRGMAVSFYCFYFVAEVEAKVAEEVLSLMEKAASAPPPAKPAPAAGADAAAAGVGGKAAAPGMGMGGGGGMPGMVGAGLMGMPDPFMMVGGQAGALLPGFSVHGCCRCARRL